MKKAFARIAAVALLGCVGCSDATGKVQGGQPLFDAAVPEKPKEAGAEGGIPGDPTWSSLYRDYFAPTGAASCTKEGFCHGGVGESGTDSSGGYACTSVKDDCYASMTSVLVPKGGSQDPTSTDLWRALRKDGKPSGMPLGQNGYKFERVDLDRLEVWIKAGAKND